MTHPRHLLAYVVFLLAANSFAQKVSFKNYSIANGLPQSDVVDVVQDSIGYLWFATQGGGIARFDGAKFDVYNQKNGLLSNFSNSLFIKKDSLFIGTNTGLSIKAKNKFTNFTSPKINTIIWLNKKLYLATNKGIYQFHKDYVFPIKINLKIDLSNVINIKFVNDFYWIKTKNQTWKSTTLNSKAVLQKSTLKEAFAVFNIQQSFINRLEIDDSIKSIIKKTFVDRQNNTWLLTQGNGVYKSVESNFKHYSNANNISINEITAIHKNNDKLWFTDTNRNLFSVDSLGIRFVRKNSFKVTSISTDSYNNLWFGSKNKGIYIFRKKNDSLNTAEYTIERLYSKNGLPNDHIQNIIIQKNTVWVVTDNAGILKLDYNFDQNFVKKISTFNRGIGLKDQNITTSLLYNKQIWYGTLNGDMGFINSDKITHYSNILNRNTTISNLTFTENKVYIGTLGEGIWKTTFNINSPKALNDAFLSSKNNYQLFIDSKNQLWNGSEKGVDKIEFTKNVISNSTSYNANDGFIGIETTKNTIVEDDNGTIWFGTKNGITKYTPSENKKNLLKPSIHFLSIDVSNQSIDSIQKQLKSTILRLSPTQNNISFEFKTVDVNQPKRIEYQYSLNKNQSSWTSKNSVHFANLATGNYSFSVKSRNAEKIESVLKTFYFYIDTPLHRKTWFIASFMGAIGIIFLLFIYFYFKRKQQKNQQKIEKLTLENHLITLEQKALQLQMNPHFIFNVLNGIKAYGNSGNTIELNTTISQFATLLRSLLHNSRKEEISLSEEIETLKNYLNLEQKIHSSFEYTIATETNTISIEEILIPPMLVQPFAENSIKHGFKNSKGKLSILFKTTKQHLICTIIDNGIGIEQSKKIKQNSAHSSVALKVTKERIENLSESSTLEIKEIFENNQVKGTKVEFQIPLKTDY